MKDPTQVDGHLKIPKIVKLDVPSLIHAASLLPHTGQLSISTNNLIYLDIDDAYIPQLFPLLHDQHIKKPNYFGEQSAGAHITVIYPEENKNVNKKDLGQQYTFDIQDLVAATLGPKTYYVLLVTSPALLQLRRRYTLPDMLCFKGYAIGLHITLGVTQA